ncbi:MAG TPA: hypothetical protein VL286_06245 [Rhizomicrobium sp.]|jgi:hypothetical protein|nr:hypothetical protein [Rhizomicrobium sp.]
MNTARRHPVRLKEHRLLLIVALAAIAYCLGAPVVGNLITHFVH